MTDAQLDRAAQGVSALVVLGFVLTCCLAAPNRPSDTDRMRACAEACGPAGMASWESFDGCECHEVRP